MGGLVEVEAVVNRIVIDYFGPDFVEDLADGGQVVTSGRAQVRVSVVDSTTNFPAIVVNSVVARNVKLDHPVGVKLLGAWQGAIGSWRFINISHDVADVAFGTKFLAAGFGTNDVTYAVTAVGQHVARVGDRVRDALVGAKRSASDFGEDVSNDVDQSEADDAKTAEGHIGVPQAPANTRPNDYVPRTAYAVHCEILARFFEMFGQSDSAEPQLSRKLAEHNIDFSIIKAVAYQELTNYEDVQKVEMDRVADSVRALATLLGFEAAAYFVFDDWDDFLHHMKMLGPAGFFHQLNQR